uniref:Uncharacterized protein n=1 Tax=Arundo donax TaxID=35708 RepID=A0A0A9G823_ARUDO
MEPCCIVFLKHCFSSRSRTTIQSQHMPLLKSFYFVART